MNITITHVNSATGASEEILNLNNKKIRAGLIKAGAYILTNGILCKILPPRRNIGMLINGAISIGIVNAAFEEYERRKKETPDYIDGKPHIYEEADSCCNCCDRCDADEDADEDIIVTTAPEADDEAFEDDLK